MKNSLEVKIEYVVKKFLSDIKGKDLQIISHFDTDGITSAAIIIQALQKLDQKFSLKIIKNLDKNFIDTLDKNRPVLFVDLASSNLEKIKESQIESVYIIDHHEVTEEIPLNVEIINPVLHEKQLISSSGLAYLFAKEISIDNKKYAKLAILGMIGDQLDKNIDKLNKEILEDGEIQMKRGLLIYPSTRPLNRVLEYSSDPFIPGVTGDLKGVLELLREAGLGPENGKYKSLLELTEDEMEKLVTGIVLRNPENKDRPIIGDLFLIKMFGKLEDARELSAKINACSRNGFPEVALAYCMENFAAKRKADSVHTKYKQELLSGIKYAKDSEKITGNNYVILNAKEEIKDTMIGTVTSILANSLSYERGTVLVGMSKDAENKRIKVSARIAGQQGRNARELLAEVMNNFTGEVGGHEFAAGCTIEEQEEINFLEKLKNSLELEVVQIKNPFVQDTPNI
jgi:single-stranded-DNA-specific exonuclease